MESKDTSQEVIEQAEQEVNEGKKRHISSKIINGDTLIELCYDQNKNETYFYIKEAGSEITKIEKYGDYLPISPDNPIVNSRVILFPSQPEDYIDEDRLLLDIKEFIHQYVDLPEEFESICTYYVMMSNLYEKLPVVPYLRVIGDWGSGKTRFLHTIGAISRNPIFASGATTTAPIFRLIDGFGGTFVLDEADFSSDMKADLTKILNQGNMPGFPILRSHLKEQHIVIPYNVFGPKIVASRGYFDDEALETPFITEKLENKRVRKDIPTTLTEEFWSQALKIRNKLLKFRLDKFLSYRNIPIEEHGDIDPEIIKDLDPRLKQITEPLLSIIRSPELKKMVLLHSKKHIEEVKANKGLTFEAGILETMLTLVFCSEDKKAYMQEIASKFNSDNSNSLRSSLSARKVGHILRTKFLINTGRDNKGIYVNDIEEKLKKLAERYNIDIESIVEAYKAHKEKIEKEREKDEKDVEKTNLF